MCFKGADKYEAMYINRFNINGGSAYSSMGNRHPYLPNFCAI